MTLSARNKLNSVYATASLFIAGIVGLLLNSWIAFVVAAAVLIACCFHDGSIRPNKRRR